MDQSGLSINCYLITLKKFEASRNFLREELSLEFITNKQKLKKIFLKIRKKRKILQSFFDDILPKRRLMPPWPLWMCNWVYGLNIFQFIAKIKNASHSAWAAEIKWSSILQWGRCQTIFTFQIRISSYIQRVEATEIRKDTQTVYFCSGKFCKNVRRNEKILNII